MKYSDLTYHFELLKVKTVILYLAVESSNKISYLVRRQFQPDNGKGIPQLRYTDRTISVNINLKREKSQCEMFKVRIYPT